MEESYKDKILRGQFDFFMSVAWSPFQQQPNGYSLGQVEVNGSVKKIEEKNKI